MATDLNIKALTSELGPLSKEIKKRREELKKLVEREKEIKKKISEFIKTNNLPGVKDQSQGIAIIAEKTEVTKRKKKCEEKDNSLNVLRHYMDDEKARKIYEEMQNSNKDKVETQKLKIISINK
jgi:hypothetical protein